MQTVAEFERIRRRELPLSRNTLVWLSLLAFSIFYFTDVCLRASGKSFWYDELLTLYFARLPDMHAIWGALKTGVDSNPPGFDLLTRATEAIFGEGLIATRLPEIFAFWGMCLCLFRFVERRAGFAAGFISMTLPMATGAYYYAYEARPLIIVAALGAAALLCWDNALGVPRRNGWLIAFSFALFVAFMLHCYAVLLIIPFGVTELIRDARDRRVNWPFWIALTAPLIPACVLYAPLFRAFGASSRGTEFVLTFPANWPNLLRFYTFLVLPCAAILLFALILFAYDRSNPVANSVGESESRRFTRQDVSLSLGFLALPVFGLLLARIVHTPYFSRYFLSALIGIVVPFGVLAGMRPQRRWITRVLAAAIVCSLAFDLARLMLHRSSDGGEGLTEPSSFTRLNTDPHQPLFLHPLISAVRKDSEPIAVIEQLDFLYLLHYAPDLTSRLYYVHSSGRDQGYRALLGFLPWSPVKYNPVALGPSFVQAHPDFYLYADLGHMEELYRISHLASIQSFKVVGDHILVKLQNSARVAPLNQHVR
ncbi:MAG: glycosyltransferase family 39 protein [Acidobacteriota bacterium]|nr:glycosyltransferase family 39 protein [Acidobacteriota bacterium]